MAKKTFGIPTRVEVEVDQDVLLVIRSQIEQQPALLNRRFSQAVKKIETRTLARLRETPPPSKPGSFRRHATAKQRRYVFSQVLKRDSAGNIIPYQRTGKFVRSWKSEVVATKEGGIFTISNTAKGKQGQYIERFITGVNQQGFHRDTGWYRSQDILSDAMVDAEDTLIDLWDEMGKNLGKKK